MKNVIIYISGLLSITSIVLVFVLSKTEKKVGYVVLADMYEKFELSKELSKKYEALQNKRNMLLDSIKYNISVAERQKLKELDYYKKVLEVKSYEFENSNSQVKEQFDEQIWKQVNQYMLEYGKDKGYSFIYGANGNGSLMYGDEAENITQNVVDYINNKYKGRE